MSVLVKQYKKYLKHGTCRGGVGVKKSQLYYTHTMIPHYYCLVTTMGHFALVHSEASFLQYVGSTAFAHGSANP